VAAERSRGGQVSGGILLSHRSRRCTVGMWAHQWAESRGQQLAPLCCAGTARSGSLDDSTTQHSTAQHSTAHDDLQVRLQLYRGAAVPPVCHAPQRMGCCDGQHAGPGPQALHGPEEQQLQRVAAAARGGGAGAGSRDGFRGVQGRERGEGRGIREQSVKRPAGTFALYQMLDTKRQEVLPGLENRCQEASRPDREFPGNHRHAAQPQPSTLHLCSRTCWVP
jgi:hypothetical protein